MKLFLVKSIITVMIFLSVVTLSNQNNNNSSNSSFWSTIDANKNISIKDQFKFWHSTMKKSYNINSYYALDKYKVFKANYEFIEEFNKKNQSFKLGITQYADMTTEEFEKEILNYNDYYERDSDHLKSKNEILKASVNYEINSKFTTFDELLEQNINKKPAVSFSEQSIKKDKSNVVNNNSYSTFDELLEAHNNDTSNNNNNSGINKNNDVIKSNYSKEVGKNKIEISNYSTFDDLLENNKDKNNIINNENSNIIINNSSSKSESKIESGYTKANNEAIDSKKYSTFDELLEQESHIENSRYSTFDELLQHENNIKTNDLSNINKFEEDSNKKSKSDQTYSIFDELLDQKNGNDKNKNNDNYQFDINTKADDDLPYVSKEVYQRVRPKTRNLKSSRPSNQTFDELLSLTYLESKNNSVASSNNSIKNSIKNQNNCGSAHIFVATTLLEDKVNESNKNSSEEINLSAQQILDCADTSCSQGSLKSIFDYLSTNKIQLESNYPYTSEKGNCKFSNNNSKNSNGGYKLISWRYINNTDKKMNANEIIKESTYGSALYVEPKYLQLYRSGVLDYSCDSTSKVNHVAVVVEINEKDNYIKVRNSFGSSWGEDGFFRIKKEESSYTCGLTKHLYLVDRVSSSFNN